MKASDFNTSKFIRATDLKNRERKLIIDNIGVAKFDDGSSRPDLGFTGTDKRLGLNKTNLSKLADAFGDEMDGWVGREIILYPDKTQYQGQITDCVRIRIPVQAADDDEAPF